MRLVSEKVESNPCLRWLGWDVCNPMGAKTETVWYVCHLYNKLGSYVDIVNVFINKKTLVMVN